MNHFCWLLVCLKSYPFAQRGQWVWPNIMMLCLGQRNSMWQTTTPGDWLQAGHIVRYKDKRFILYVFLSDCFRVNLTKHYPLLVVLAAYRMAYYGEVCCYNSNFYIQISVSSLSIFLIVNFSVLYWHEIFYICIQIKKKK